MPNVKPPIRSLEDIDENLSSGKESYQVEEELLEEVEPVRPKGVAKASDLRRGIFRNDEEEEKKEGEDEGFLEEDPLDDESEYEEAEALAGDDAEKNLDNEDFSQDLNSVNQEENDSEHQLEKPLEELSQDDSFQKGVYGDEEPAKEEKLIRHRSIPEDNDAITPRFESPPKKLY